MRIGSRGLLGSALLGISLLAACDRHTQSPPQTYSVGGTVAGLSGNLTLANNGGDARTVSANGAFTFATPVNGGVAYNVTVTAQPGNQTCTVARGSGTVGSTNVTNVAVTCVAVTYTVGGTVSGLSGTGLVLRNNGGDDLARSADGAFTFATGIATGGGYTVTVQAQPTNQRCALGNATGSVASANVTNVTVTCETVKVTMDIGPTGGTITGPDGVQIVVPPGALGAHTTIGIERNGGAWPQPLPDDAVAAGGVIYEFTPHDIVFDKPVLFRMAAPAGAVADPGAFVASFGEGWMPQIVVVNGGFVEWERPTLSWAFIPTACSSTGPPAPYSCTYSSGSSFVTADPPGAITLLSTSAAIAVAPNSAQGTAGTYALNTSTLTTMHLTMNYTVPGDCGSATLQFNRYTPGAVPPSQLVAETGAPLASIDARYAGGSARVDVPAQEFAGTGTQVYGLRLKCSMRSGGLDWIAFALSPSGSPGFTIGGPMSGLTTAGLVLRNNGREELAVQPNVASYAFTTPQADATSYNVVIKRQPTGAVCTVQNPAGTVASANVTNASVTCTPTTPPTGPLVLTANSNANNVTIVRRTSGAGALSVLGNVSVASTPTAIALTSDGRFAYVANQIGSSVSSFSVNKTAGSLTLIPLSSPGTFNPFGVVVDPQNRFLFVANGNGNTVSSFTIDSASGALAAVAGSPFATGAAANTVGVHPSGSFVYVVNELASSISMFSVNGTTGALTSIGTLSNSAKGPGIAFTPNGKFMYVANLSSGSIARFAVNTSTGQLTSAGSTISNNANSVVVHPSGTFLYVANNGSHNDSAISQFAIDSATGALTPVGSPLVLPKPPTKLAIDTTGTFLYATIQIDNSVASFAIDSVTGALTAAGSAATGNGPMGVVVTP